RGIDSKMMAARVSRSSTRRSLRASVQIAMGTPPAPAALRGVASGFVRLAAGPILVRVSIHWYPDLTMPLPLFTSLLLLPLLAADAAACSVPVFRFAFENWNPAPHQVIVLRRGPLNEAQQTCVRRLRDAATSNINVIEVDLSGKPETKWLKLSE